MKSLLDQQNIGILAERLKSAYNIACQAATGDEFASDVINWYHFSRQMVYFMGKEYSQTVKQGENVPGDVYGLPSITIRPGDGWGFIDRDMLFEDLAKQGVRQQEEFVERFFTPATSSRRQLPQNLLVFNERAYGVLNVDNPYERDQSTEERLLRSIFGEPDRSAQAEPVVKVSQSEVRLLEKLYDKYALGMRSNGRDEDLGPMNGPLPLTEMINANYLLTTLVIDRMSH